MSGEDDLKRVLAPFLRGPTNSYKQEDLRQILEDMSADPIQKALQKLEKDKILDAEFSRGRPKGGNRVKNYQVMSNILTFDKLLQLYLEKDVEVLLMSNYVELLIKKSGFKLVYGKIRENLENASFREIASDALLSRLAVQEEYEKIALALKKEISNKDTIFNDWTDSELRESLEILSNFDSLKSIRFYRKIVHKIILGAYKKLETRSIITKGVHTFLAFDTYLSPLSSYPINDVSQLLLSPYPFQRIYEDAYLLDGEAFEVLLGRAAAIYNYFADFIFEFFMIDPPEPERIEVKTKEFIFFWNIASARFDLISFYLADLFSDRIGSGMYHIKSDGMQFQIFDAENDEELIQKKLGKEILMMPFVLRDAGPDELVEPMDNPFEFIRPCRAFQDMRNRSGKWRYDLIPLEEILLKLNSRLTHTKIAK